MKKKYIQPNVSVSFVVVESLLQSASQGSIYKDQTGDGGGCSKENNFSSWDYDFDEEDESESNFSSKSLWD
mgnify:CR=1 FL=1